MLLIYYFGYHSRYLHKPPRDVVDVMLDVFSDIMEIAHLVVEIEYFVWISLA